MDKYKEPEDLIGDDELVTRLSHIPGKPVGHDLLSGNPIQCVKKLNAKRRICDDKNTIRQDVMVWSGLALAALYGCGASSSSPAGALTSSIMEQSYDGTATLTVPAGTVLYSDTAKSKPVFGPYTTNVLKLRAIPKTVNVSQAGAFKNYSTLTPQAQNGWVQASDGTPDVTQEIKSVDAVVDIRIRRKYTLTVGPGTIPASKNVDTFSSPVTVNLKVPVSYTVGSNVPYYSFDITKNSWVKGGTATVKADNTIDMSVTYTAQWGVVTFQNYTPPGNPGNGYVPAGTYTTTGIYIPGISNFNKVTFLVDKVGTTALATVIGQKNANGTPEVAVNGGAISGTISPTNFGASSYAFTATIAAGTVNGTTVGPITFTGTIDPVTGVLSGTYSCITPAVTSAPFAAVNSYMTYKANAQAFAATDMILNANLRCQLESVGGRGLPLGTADNDYSRGLNAGFEAEWVFDNLAVIGTNWVKCFVLKTSTDLVLIDTMDSQAEANAIIIPAMYKLGLDPTKITKIFLTHGHFDHYGGAKTMQDQAPGSVVYMSAMDDAYMRNMFGKPGSPPPGYGTVNIPAATTAITDGQQFNLGDATVTAVFTPGHTPGCTSFIIPVKDNGVAHVAALLGGNGVPQTNFDAAGTYPGAGLANAATYIASLDYFSTYTAALNVDTTLNLHPFVDNAAGLTKLLRNRKPGAPHPWVLGKAKYKQYEGVTREVAKAYYTRFNSL